MFIFSGTLTAFGNIKFSTYVFYGVMDTFSVMLIQVLLIGGGAETGITWWMEMAYAISDRRQSAPRNFRFSEHFSLCL